MKTNEILMLYALKFKQELLQGHSDLNENDPLWMSDEIAKTRNICAFISEPMSQEIDRLCSVFAMSKRRFVELALRDLAEKSNQTVEGVGLTNVMSSSMGQVPTDEV